MRQQLHPPRVCAELDPRRALLLALLQSALAAVDGRALTARCLGARSTRGEWWVAAVGKAAAAMALGAYDVLGGALRRTLVITKDGHHDAEAQSLPGLTLCESSHPVPDERSLLAGGELLRFAHELPPGAQVLFLVSGGASALVEALAPGVELDDLRALNVGGLAQGLDIAALNARRQQISRLKGGRFAALLEGRPALALFLSDVPTDAPSLIGSGLLGMSPPPADAHDRIERIVLASIDTAVDAVRQRTPEHARHAPLGRFDGDAAALGLRFASELLLAPPGLTARGGESVVQLPAQPGRGGRSQHLALCAAQHLAGSRDVFLLAVGTDGTDGPTSDAGALVDGETALRVRAAGLDPQECLARADSAAALAAAGDLVHTGPTGTNVGDLVLTLKLSEGDARDWLDELDDAADLTTGPVPCACS
jgi:glycerate 2-kinase